MLRKSFLLITTAIILLTVMNVFANDHHTIIIQTNNTQDTLVKPLSGVISGPLPCYHSQAPDLTPQLQDIGVTSIRNNDYWDDRLDIESIF